MKAVARRIVAEALLARLLCAVLSGLVAYGLVRAGASAERALGLVAVFALGGALVHQWAKRHSPPQAKPFKERARGAAG